MSKVKIGIIGAGASGMVAAIFAKRFGAEVMLFEQLDRVGKKILATGNGRCNITNSNIDISRYHGESKKFAFSALKAFNSSNTQDFFEELGIFCKEEDEGKIFPYSDQASSVLDVLRHELEVLNVKEIISTKIEKVEKNKSGFKIISSSRDKYYVDKVIIATGGKSSQNLGSRGIGYKLSEMLGHKIITPFPSLVQIKLDFNSLKAIKGVKFIGNASVLNDNKVIKEYSGEVLFTDYGISGPPILQLSREALSLYNNGKKPYIKVDLFKDIKYDDLYLMLKNRFESAKCKSIDFSLIGLVNKKLIPIVLREAKINDVKRDSNSISEKEIESLCSILKSWKFKVIGSNGWEHSQVTAGGVSTKDINPKTLESKLVNGLYFAGEVIDIDGDCGGYNLQWAWSSGYVAGYSSVAD